MNFEAVPPDFAIKLRGGWAWKIYADGSIDGDEGERFAEFLIRSAIPFGSELYLNSPGGSLLGGMSLGKIVREFGLITHVGRKGVFRDGFQFSQSGICMSACALSFLGGVYRFVGPDSQYGVHQFRLDDERVDSASVAQRLSASIVDYIRSMNVDHELFSIASEIPASEMLVLPPETLERLGVVNNGFERPQWTIESIEDCLYLKGLRNTIYGLQKYMVVFPAKGAPYLYFVFGIEGVAEAALSMDSDRFLIDGECIDAREFRISRFVEHGNLNAMYAIPNGFLDKLILAKSVGYYLQFSEEAPVFLGIGEFPLEGAATKLPGLVAVHARGSG